jgi:succinate dehydrogenase / fumarate reductase flavoprotein subunit
MPSLEATDEEGKVKEANQWCDKFEENNNKWLKSTIAEYDGEHPQITYEDVDVSLIPPRPRLYGLVGGEVIEKVWKERLDQKKPEMAGSSS